MPRPQMHQRGDRPCGGYVRAIYTRKSVPGTGRMAWVSMGWLCDRCHRWAADEWELTT